MRWYVMSGGRTVGPMDGETIAQSGKEGRLITGMLVREEPGGTWIPIERSPFAAFVRNPAAEALVRREAQRGKVTGIVVIGLIVAWIVWRTVPGRAEAPVNLNAVSVSVAPPLPTAAPPSAGPPAYAAALGAYLAWVEASRKAPQKVKGRTECLGPSDITPGVCMKNYFTSDGREMYDINYFGKRPTAVRLHASFSNASIPCSAIAPSRVVRGWRYASLRKFHCIITGGPLVGLELLVSSATAASAFDATDVFVFTREYLTYDQGFRDVIEQEGGR